MQSEGRADVHQSRRHCEAAADQRQFLVQAGQRKQQSFAIFRAQGQQFGRLLRKTFWWRYSPRRSFMIWVAGNTAQPMSRCSASALAVATTTGSCAAWSCSGTSEALPGRSWVPAIR